MNISETIGNFYTSSASFISAIKDQYYPGVCNQLSEIMRKVSEVAGPYLAIVKGFAVQNPVIAFVAVVILGVALLCVIDHLWKGSPPSPPVFTSY